MIEYRKNLDIVKESGEIKKLVKFKIKELNIDENKLCEKLGLKLEDLRRWLHTPDATDNHIRFKQCHILKLLEELGVNVKITLIVPEAFIVDFKLLKT